VKVVIKFISIIAKLFILLVIIKSVILIPGVGIWADLFRVAIIDKVISVVSRYCKSVGWEW
jgi:hypothetical protein